MRAVPCAACLLVLLYLWLLFVCCFVLFVCVVVVFGLLLIGCMIECCVYLLVYTRLVVVMCVLFVRRPCGGCRRSGSCQP